MKGKVGRVVALVAIAGVIVGTVIGNNILLEPTLSQNITGLLCPPLVDSTALEASRAEGQALSQQIEQDGCVLVKNNGVLPLSSADDGEINVFGHSSIDWIYGGSGSGQVVPENNNSAENIDLYDALDEYNIVYNTDLKDMYTRYATAAGDRGSISNRYDAFYILTEPDISDSTYYTSNILTGAKSFSDVAFVVIGRTAGETEDPTRIQYKSKTTNDTSRHYLEISTEEENLLKYVGANYDKVIVIVNSTNTMELDFVDTIPGIDACLVVGATGTRGAQAIPSVLYGDVSPSGHFTDTYAYDLSSNISYQRTSAEGSGHYTNASELYPTGSGNNAGDAPRTAPAFIDYVEGIYVGYKWYETADAEGVWDKYTRTILDENDKEVTVNGYESVVQYPFGYGMSYTTFDWAVSSLSVSSGSTIDEKSEITLEIRVTNTGDYAGKDVVEVYLNPPYTKGGIEKSAVTLVGFAKTATIEPNESQLVTITLDPYDFASYDAYDKNSNGFKGYELEAGDYNLQLMTDAHTVKTVSFDKGAQNTEGVITYKVAQTVKLEKDKYTGATVSNKFTGEDAVDGASLDGSDSGQNIGFISRSSFPDPASMTAVADRTMADNVKTRNTWTKDMSTEWDNATEDAWGNAVAQKTVTWGATAKASDWKYTTTDENGEETTTDYSSCIENSKAKVYTGGAVTKLGLLLGSDYDNPLWDSLLDQITLTEARTLVLSGSFGNAAIDSVGKPRLSDYDGPNQVRSFNAGGKRGTGFPCSTVLAQTWDSALAYTFGLNYGKEMNVLNVQGVYGFGVNLHRSAWGGRNYEYFSEDGFLSGTLLVQEVRALKNTGKYCYLKHLALYETENERDSMYTWCTEQALRENYLRPFQMATEQADCLGMMTSYNRIGSTWTGGSEALIQGVARTEWGFHGTIVTDYVDSWSQDYMSIENAVRAGGDILLGGRDSSLDTDYEKSSNRFQAQVKEVCHHVLYTFLNAAYANQSYNEQDDVEQIINVSIVNSWVWWQPLLYDLDILIGGGCLIALYFVVRGFFVKTTKETTSNAESPEDKIMRKKHSDRD